jgi:hypothetical protein
MPAKIGRTVGVWSFCTLGAERVQRKGKPSFGRLVPVPEKNPVDAGKKKPLSKSGFEDYR